MKYGLTFLIMLGCLSFSMLSSHQPLVMGGKFATLDEVNSRLYVMDLQGVVVETKQLTQDQYNQVSSNWIATTIKQMGLQTLLNETNSQWLGQVQTSELGKAITYTSDFTGTVRFGNFYRPIKTDSIVTVENIDFSKPIFYSTMVNVNQVINPTEKVLIVAPEVRLGTGFHAKSGSEVRIIGR